MILVDQALQERERLGNPIRVGLIGAGYMGRGLAIQIIHSYKNGMRLSAIYNRTDSKAHQAYTQAGVENFSCVDTQQSLEHAIKQSTYAVCSDPLAICRAENIDVIVEATGEVEFGAAVVTEAIKHGKHVVLMNAELDALCGRCCNIALTRLE